MHIKIWSEGKVCGILVNPFSLVLQIDDPYQSEMGTDSWQSIWLSLHLNTSWGQLTESTETLRTCHISTCMCDSQRRFVPDGATYRYSGYRFPQMFLPTLNPPLLMYWPHLVTVSLPCVYLLQSLPSLTCFEFFLQLLLGSWWPLERGWRNFLHVLTFSKLLPHPTYIWYVP